LQRLWQVVTQEKIGATMIKVFSFDVYWTKPGRSGSYSGRKRVKVFSKSVTDARELAKVKAAEEIESEMCFPVGSVKIGRVS
jgi:hypothetical protein